MPVDLKELDSSIRKARAASSEKPWNFALRTDGTADGTALLVHRRKAVNALKLEAKDQSKGTRKAAGTFTVDRKTLVLACEEGSSTTGIAKPLRALFKLGVSAATRVRVLDCNGEETEADGEPDMEAEAEAESGAGEAPEPDDILGMQQSKLAIYLRKIKPKYPKLFQKIVARKDLVKTPEGMSTLIKAIAQFERETSSDKTGGNSSERSNPKNADADANVQSVASNVETAPWLNEEELAKLQETSSETFSALEGELFEYERNMRNEFPDDYDDDEEFIINKLSKQISSLQSNLSKIDEECITTENNKERLHIRAFLREPRDEELYKKFETESEDLRKKKAHRDELKTQLDEKYPLLSLAKTKKSLAGFIRFGPGSEDPSKLDDEGRAAIIKVIADDPSDIEGVFALIQRCEHPNALACSLSKINQISGWLRIERPDDEDLIRKFRSTAIQNIAHMGDAYAKGLDDYFFEDRHEDPDPLALGKREPNVKACVAALARTMFDSEGKLDLDSPEFKAALDHVLYHPNMMTGDGEAVMVREHVLKMVELLKDPERAEGANKILSGLTVPTNSRAKDLVARSVGKDRDSYADGNRPQTLEEIDLDDVRAAVLSAILKPVYQGNVGSCFVNGPLRVQMEEDPVTVMKGFAEVAMSATVETKDGLTVPVPNVDPKDINPIQRSYEYAIASAGGFEHQKEVKTEFDRAMGKCISKVCNRSNFASGASNGNLDPQLANKLATVDLEVLQKRLHYGFIMHYDETPEASRKVAADGRSTKGRFWFFSEGMEKIDSQDKLHEEIARIFADVADVESSEDSIAEIKRIIARTKVFDKPGRSRFPSLFGEKHAFWEIPGGGFSYVSLGVLTGKSHDLHSIVPEKKALLATVRPKKFGVPKLSDQESGKRTVSILKDLLKGAGSNPQKESVLRSSSHAFSTTRMHSTMQERADADPEEVAKKVREFEDDGKRLSRTALETGQVEYLLRQVRQTLQTTMHVSVEPYTVADIINLIIPASTSKTEINIGDLKKQILLSFKTFRKNAEEHLKSTNRKKVELAKFESAGYDVYTFYKDAILKGRDKTIKQEMKKHENETRNKLEQIRSTISDAFDEVFLTQLKFPKIVFADTNWGSPDHHRFLVAAADPSTGEPTIWRKTLPDGHMKKMGDEWIRSYWYQLSEKPEAAEAGARTTTKSSDQKTGEAA